MSLSILNNIPSIVAQNQLSITNSNLQKTLFRLSSGSRINSGADDAAGLAIADGLKANITALTQSAQNASGGVGALQVSDGALAQVTTLLNRAVTLATESANGTVSSGQRVALNAEFTQIKAEIDRIGGSTTFNGTSVFTANTTSIFLTDASSAQANNVISVNVGLLSQSTIAYNGSTVDLSADTLTSDSAATTALGHVNSAIANVAGLRGSIGASINRLQSAVNVINAQVQNLTSAEDGIRAADIPSEVANLSRYTILNQSGISALAQANSTQQSILNLLR